MAIALLLYEKLMNYTHIHLITNTQVLCRQQRTYQSFLTILVR